MVDTVPGVTVVDGTPGITPVVGVPGTGVVAVAAAVWLTHPAFSLTASSILAMST